MMKKTKKARNLLTSSPERGAGVLLHITSLPGPYGAGDLGKEAKKFADSLQRAGQKYWQVLPLNPIEKDKGFSPYSSTSSMAGNTLLISPEQLAEEGWLRKDELKKYRLPSHDRADFEKCEQLKGKLFDLAFEQFGRSKRNRVKDAFVNFCTQEKNWLDEFALFVLLKRIHRGRPWYEWPSEFKNRDVKALKKIGLEHEDELNKTKWLQFIFFNQWNSFRTYCNGKGIRLFGDLPFYVSYDSADVWAHRHIFSVDKKGEAQFVAGVPPDYFNENGQLWGMPVFRWDVLKRENYFWWIQRLRKNIDLFDLLRLDHFRAFADYWAVPAKDDTAKNGTWKPGPGNNFFRIVAKELGELPFVAEDLGDIDDKVLSLRDEFAFPGMKVLHFAFSGNMATSDYIPHNYTRNFVVYTGTHDNNTTKGWFRKDISPTEQTNLQKYFASEKISPKTINSMLIRLAYSSVAKIAMIPAQDLLGLDEKARFNAPATLENNWVWRLLPGSIKSDLEKWVKSQVEIFNR